MRTTMSIAYDALVERYPAAMIGERFDPGAFACLVYDGLRAGAKRLHDEVYVLSGKVLSDTREQLDDYVLDRCIVVVSPGEVATGDCAITVSTIDSASDVAAALEDALLEYRRVFGRMSSLTLKGADVSQLVECAHRLLRNPVLVHDAALRVRAHTERDMMNDSLWPSLDSSFEECLLPEGISRFVGQVSSSNEITRYVTPDGVTTHSLRTKEIGGAFLIISLLQKNKDVTEGDRLVLRKLCRLIEMGMKTNAQLAKEELGYSGLLLDALEGRISGPVEFANRMSALGYEVRAVASLILVAPQKGEFSDRQAQRFTEDIFNTFPFGMGVRYKEHLVFYGTYDDAGTITPADLARFEAFLGKFKMVAALGSPHPTDQPLADLYQNALVNLRVGRKVYPGKHLLLSQDCQPFWAYEACMAQGDPDLYIHPALSVLQRHDSRTKDTLYEVLSTLALCRGNRSAAAQELAVQRNTLQSRIKEIELICHIDLSDPFTVDHIRRSIVLEGYRGASESGV